MIFKDSLVAFIYFALSTLLTWWFVALSPMYISPKQMILSTAIAGGKWGIQILLGLIFLERKRWPFVKEIGFVCFSGSCILLPYVGLSFLKIWDHPNFFIGSLIFAVVVMILLYRKGTMKLGLPYKWWLFWLASLGIAITLQLTMVFHQ